jgi:3-hydroxyacyl-[acyl-carrier-protein] dehydratase
VLAREWLPAVVDRLKHGPLIPDGAGVPVCIGRRDLERLLPHRPPMLLVDAVEVVDRAGQGVRGRRRIRDSDIGLLGHFPDGPVYPGMLLVETMGQLALTLLHFTTTTSLEVPVTAAPPRVRATHVHYAAFLAPVVPGDELAVYAQVVDSSFTMIAAGQVYRSGMLAAYAVSEVYVDD